MHVSRRASVNFNAGFTLEILSNVILIEIAELEFVRSGKLENVRKVLLENVLEKL